ncbi:transcriptional regulator [Methylobacterium currus]|uniref:Transcriptional regulator n=2 Tax=Methylobacterium TaxID=407 RepID=A0A2R4WUJ2_9HYPH|nr:transcriptional regulator [Methylobacterium currus]TGD95196.1 transcriptional regulator [Methylobacterium nonmethylotrophicum]
MVPRPRSLTARPWTESFEPVTIKNASPVSIGEDHRHQIPRLRRIEGQIRGLQKMIETENNCIDVVYQIDAAIGALRRVQSDIIRVHLEALTQRITAQEITETERLACVDEIATLMIRVV